MLISQERISNKALCACVNMQKYITLQESVAWYNSYTVIEKFQHFKSKNSGKIQWPITIIRVVEEFQLLLSH